MPLNMTGTSAPVARQFIRPNFPDNPQLQTTLRNLWDLVYQMRDGYGPNAQYAAGGGQALPVDIGTTDAGFGLTLKLGRAGTWMVRAAVSIDIDGDTGQVFTLSLQVNGNPLNVKATAKMPGDALVMMHQTWQVTAKGGESLVLYINKDAGGGTSTVQPQNSTLSATWQGPL